jgi:hypothetical protein
MKLAVGLRVVQVPVGADFFEQKAWNLVLVHDCAGLQKGPYIRLCDKNVVFGENKEIVIICSICKDPLVGK